MTFQGVRHFYDSFSSPNDFDSCVVSYTEQPTLEVTFLTVGGQRFERFPKRVLERVFTVVLVLEHLPEISVEPFLVMAEQITNSPYISLRKIALYQDISFHTW